ncbi:MAG: PilZ domain-containing protein [Desulfohalobiaceae bacterium]
MNQDRRQYQRLPKDFRVELKELSFAASGHQAVQTRCLNVSAGGLLLETSRSFNLGQKVQVRLFVPSLNRFHPSFFKVFESSLEQSLLAVAEVARVEEKLPLQLYQVGIRFLDVYEDDWQALYKMLDSASREA